MTRDAAFAPLVTIVIPSFNYGRYLARAIDSALSQDYQHVEVLVIDNASTDESAAVIARYRDDKRFTAVFNDENIGRNQNCNRGAELSKGEYLLFLSADDYYLPGAVSTLVAFLRAHSECDAVYANVLECDRDGHPVKVSRLPGHVDVEEYSRRNTAAALLASTSYMWLPTFLCEREAFFRYGGFDTSFAVGCDFALGCRMAFDGVRVGFVNQALACIRFHGGNATWEYTTSGLSLREFIRVCDELLVGDAISKIRGEELAPLDAIEFLAGARHEHAELARAYSEQQEKIDELRTRLLSFAAAHRAFRSAPDGASASVIYVVTERTRLAGLDRSIESVLAQSHQNVEVIVMDCGATSLKRRFEGMKNVRYLRYSGSTGESGARNTAVRLSDGDVLFFQSDRSRMRPDWIAQAIEAIAASDSDSAVCDSEIVFEVTPQPFEGCGKKIRHGVLSASDGMRRLAHAPSVPLEVLALRRSRFLRRGWFPDAGGMAAEWLFVLGRASDAPVSVVRVVGVELAIHTDLSNSGAGPFATMLNAVLSRVYGSVSGSDQGALHDARSAYVRGVNAALEAAQSSNGAVENLWELLLAVFGEPGDRLPLHDVGASGISR